jgi:AcrR family transcriptional regulator
MSTSRAAPARKKPQARQNAERREASVDLLLGSALRLFVSQGYRSTNLEQISSAARLTKGAVYFYFGSKEQVLVEVLKRVREIVVERAIVAVDAAGDDPVGRLVAYIHYQARLGITHRDEVLLLILMSLEFKERAGEVNDFIAALHRKQRKLIESLVAAGQRIGSVRADVPARELAAIVLATHDGTFLEWFRRSPSLRGRELTRALRVVLLGGVAVPPA